MAQQSRLGKLATTVRTDGDGLTRVRYHQTDVVSFNDKQVILNTGGWYTSTTKTRINQASAQFGLGLSVFQKGGEWFVNYKGKVSNFIDNAIIERC